MRPRMLLPKPLADVVVWCISMLAVAGCNEPDPRSVVTEDRLRAIATAYLDYAVAKGAGPRSREELLRCMKHMPPFKRAGALQKQASPEEAWQSARDGEPFIVHYGLPVSANSGLDVPVIAFEAHGDGEHRYVAFANGKVKRVSEEDMKQCLRDQQ